MKGIDYTAVFKNSVGASLITKHTTNSFVSAYFLSKAEAIRTNRNFVLVNITSSTGARYTEEELLRKVTSVMRRSIS